MSAPDAQLRANVRLLGDVLGNVLVEQEGDALLVLEERIRGLARDARETGDSAELTEAIRALDLGQQSAVLRAFSLFFQLANIAEQHHRLRRRRQYEHEGRVPRESLADAVARLREAGVGDDELSAAAARLEVRPVLTAHPTEASRRTILQAHQRLATALRRLDDPELPNSTQGRVREQIAEEVTILWQTDEVRSRRPRVVDEIRNGLWFVEASLWQALPRLVRELRDAIPGAPPPLRLGTWIGGDMDGNPNAGADTIVDALERARTLARDLLRRDVRALGSAWGMSTELVGPVPELESTSDEPYRGELVRIWSGSQTTGTATPTSSPMISHASTRRFVLTARPASPTVLSPTCARGSTCSDYTWRRSISASMRRRYATSRSTSSPRLRRPQRRGSATGLAPSTA